MHSPTQSLAASHRLVHHAMTGGQDGEIELDLDSLSRKALWALHDLYINSAAARHGPPRKNGGGRSGTPGPPRANSQAGAMTHQPEVARLYAEHAVALQHQTPVWQVQDAAARAVTVLAQPC